MAAVVFIIFPLKVLGRLLFYKVFVVKIYFYAFILQTPPGYLLKYVFMLE
jgi:hypothetical protein